MVFAMPFFNILDHVGVPGDQVFGSTRGYRRSVPGQVLWHAWHGDVLAKAQDAGAKRASSENAWFASHARNRFFVMFAQEWLHPDGTLDAPK